VLDQPIDRRSEEEANFHNVGGANGIDRERIDPRGQYLHEKQN
jgi:hypothetical protein